MELSQPVAVVVRTTEPLVLTCKVTGYSVSSGSVDYATGWIRHPKGKPLEWISHIWDNGDIYKNNALSSKFTISRDSTSNSVSLRGQNLQESDTAVYYCARLPYTHSDTEPCKLPAKTPGKGAQQFDFPVALFKRVFKVKVLQVLTFIQSIMFIFSQRKNRNRLE